MPASNQASLSSKPLERETLKSVARALADVGARFVPLQLTPDCTSFCTLSGEQAEALGCGSGASDSRLGAAECIWFLTGVGESAGPPSAKTLAKMAQGEGWRLAIVPGDASVEHGSSPPDSSLTFASRPSRVPPVR